MKTGTILHKSAINCIAMSGLPAMARMMRTREICIFMFHGFTDKEHAEDLENAGGLHMQVSRFDALCELLSNKYNVLSLAQVAEMIGRNEPVPPNSVALTFDDGYASNYSLAFPILKKHRLPATIFVATDFVDNNAWLWHDRLEFSLGSTKRKHVRLTILDRRIELPLVTLAERMAAAESLQSVLKALPQEVLHREMEQIENALECSIADCEIPPAIYESLSWNEINEMQDSGFVTIGAHTHTHRIVGRCDIQSAWQEIATGKALIEANTGRAPEIFAYPNGKPGDHTPETRELLVELGFTCAVTTETGFNNGGSDLMALRRFGNSDNCRHMDALASGAMRLLSRLKSTVTPGTKE